MGTPLRQLCNSVFGDPIRVNRPEMAMFAAIKVPETAG